MALRSFSDYRVLIVPGLHNSGPGHWQSRWQRLYPQFERVEQDNWEQPDLAAWSARLDRARREDSRPTLSVAHSFGCLTTAHSLARDPHGVAGVLLVGPADGDVRREHAALGVPGRPAATGRGLPLVPHRVVRAAHERLQPAVLVGGNGDVRGEHAALRVPGRPGRPRGGRPWGSAPG